MEIRFYFEHKNLKIWKWKNANNKTCLTLCSKDGSGIVILNVNMRKIRKQIGQDFVSAIKEKPQRATKDD